MASTDFTATGAGVSFDRLGATPRRAHAGDICGALGMIRHGEAVAWLVTIDPETRVMSDHWV
ncbi:hypothetical protein SAMN05421811_113215 [Nonomuraea wenchangensis]|uniref:Uncharacterized protein n=1 Tax=Nonomuraea wenchangensis TaxID=568860 RepID=A0A1I0LAC8_9ACTN|nr:hypothetical protein SAMN05421811_113215 [Nonomuraea wenchangensis]